VVKALSEQSNDLADIKPISAMPPPSCPAWRNAVRIEIRGICADGNGPKRLSSYHGYSRSATTGHRPGEAILIN
jgi:hypothetical protein